MRRVSDGRSARLGAWLTFAAALWSGCVGGCERTMEEAGVGGRVLVLAAASVADAAEEVGRLYGLEAGVEVRVSRAGSNALARQILAGAPGDLFLSANEAWASAVMDAGMGVESEGLLSNRLVLVVPRGNPGRLRSPHDLAQGRVERIALAGEHVPAGEYAERALRSLGIFEAIRTKVVRGESVRFALAYVERGEVDAAVVYATDAGVSDRVDVLYEFEEREDLRIVYPLVLLEGGAERAEARGVWEFMLGDRAGAVFAGHGFVVVRARGAAEGGGE